MRKLLIATLLCGFAMPAFAMSADMSCKDFNAMDSAGQMKAVTEMDHAMKSDKMASADKGAMKSGSMESDGDKMTMQVAAACKEKPEMMVGDAMKHGKM